jgi:hypothetical protein
MCAQRWIRVSLTDWSIGFKKALSLRVGVEQAYLSYVNSCVHDKAWDRSQLPRFCPFVLLCPVVGHEDASWQVGRCHPKPLPFPVNFSLLAHISSIRSFCSAWT